jgi:hypothetical protein
MHVCMHACTYAGIYGCTYLKVQTYPNVRMIRMYISSFIHTHANVYTQTLTDTTLCLQEKLKRLWACVYNTYILPHIHTYARTHIHTYTPTNKQTSHNKARLSTYTQTRIHAYVQTGKHTYIYTYIQASPL